MSIAQTPPLSYVQTDSGRIAYRATGTGPPALFVHGVFLNGHMWNAATSQLADLRTCIAVDLLAHGATGEAPGADLSFAGQAEMLRQFVDALGFDEVDLVANDSGGGIAQIFAAKNANRIRSLTLTNCDVHDGWPPPAFQPTVELLAGNDAETVLLALAADPAGARDALSVGLEYPGRISDELVTGFFEPLVRDRARIDAVRSFFESMDCADTVAVELQLRELRAPTLIVWGGADIFFGREWAAWLRDTIPGVRRVVELPTAKLFFPLDRPSELAAEVALHWTLSPETAP